MPGTAIALLVQEGGYGLEVLMVGSAREKIIKLKSQHTRHILMLHIRVLSTLCSILF